MLLAKIVSLSDRVGLCTPEVLAIPEGWHALVVFSVAQMVCNKLLENKYQDAIVFIDQHIADMSELATLTQPGPFVERTMDTFRLFLVSASRIYQELCRLLL